MIQVKPQIAALSTYAPPWSDMDRTEYLRLDLNENTLPPPEYVKTALNNYIDANRIQLYPSYSQFLTRLSRYVGVPEQQLIITNGSDQAIEIVLRAFLGSNDEMLMAQPGFPMFTQIAGVIGAKIVGIPYTEDLRFPHTAFFAAITAATQLVVL
ncbi:MAG: aminotransferase class I/II-fold pyridoxal phosphate-dependent enzyme, partial [Candidatus Electrothrix sp. MAN1_4]|nr:aminotransferase class I/II-fold pyridoxal phosphate-dependent enzyme [Candidatus Electrothrix sp. MAN1_4]